MEQEANNEGKSPPAAPNEGLSGGRKRPRIDLTADSRQYKRGKSMFGILLGTLNKAKQEDHDRSLSDAVSSISLVRPVRTGFFLILIGSL